MFRRLVVILLLVVMVFNLGVGVSAFGDYFTQSFEVGFGGGRVDIEFQDISTIFGGYGDVDFEEPKITYKDEILFGNGDFGHDDGEVWESSIGVIWSMVVDNSNDIWFIDQDISYVGMGELSTLVTGRKSIYHESIKYGKQLLRKYSFESGKVETVLDLNRARISYVGKDGKDYRLTDFRAYKLVHDPKTDKVYLSGKFVKNMGINDYKGVIFEVSPEIKAVIGDGGIDYMFGADDLAFVDDNGNIIFSRKYGTRFDVFRVREGGTQRSFVGGNRSQGTSKSVIEGIVVENYLYVLVRDWNWTVLRRYDMREGKWENIERFDGDYSSIGVDRKNNNFIAFKDGNIYNINLKGYKELVVDYKEVDMGVGFGKGTPKLMNMMNDGSIVYYDESNGVVRRVSSVIEF
jgi:hypothetical protein